MLSDLSANYRLGGDRTGKDKSDNTTLMQDELEGLNARERNQLRRKQRKMSKLPPPPTPVAGGAGGGRATVTDQPQDAGKVVVEFTGEGEAAALDPNEWPLASLCEDLCHDIFDAVWEVQFSI